MRMSYSSIEPLQTNRPCIRFKSLRRNPKNVFLRITSGYQAVVKRKNVDRHLVEYDLQWA